MGAGVDDAGISCSLIFSEGFAATSTSKLFGLQIDGSDFFGSAAVATAGVPD